MGRIVEFTPKTSALTEGYTIKYTAPDQTLTTSPNFQDWTVVNLGDHPHTPNSRMWVVFNSAWLGESINARVRPNGLDADPSYTATINAYRSEQIADPQNVHIIKGTDTTVVLRRTSRLDYLYSDPIDFSNLDEAEF